MKNLIQLLSYFKSYKLWTFLGAFLVFFEVLMDLFLPSIMSNIINIGIANQNISYIIWNIVFMFILTLIGILGGIFSTYFTAKATSFISKQMRHDVIYKVANLSFHHLDQLKVGNIVTILTDDIMTVGNIFIMGIRILFRVPIILVGSLILAIMMSPKLSILFIPLIPLMAGIMFFVMRTSLPYFEKTQDITDEMNRLVRENVYGIRTVKSFGKEQDSIREFQKVNQKLMNNNIKAVHIMTFAMPTIMFLINVAVVLVLLIGGKEASLPVGNIIAFTQYLTNILSTVMMGSMMIVMLSKSEVSAKRIQSILKLPDEKFVGNDCLQLHGAIQFSHVTFSYDDGLGDAVLKDISFEVQPGEVIAIVGGTGSGKTTLVSLLCRFYEHKAGSIILDEKEISSYDISYLHEQISICPQHPFLFSGTILDNLEMGKHYDLKKVKSVLKLVCADDFIEQKSHGIYSKVEQKGTNFSGGEKQRLSLARTLLRNPKIFILDDATSAIDLKTEKIILKNIKSYLKGKTVLWISNRIATIQNADKIIVLEDGKIEAVGTHLELLKKSKSYYDMYVSQQIGGVVSGK